MKKPEHTITMLRSLLEADERLRRLERQWSETGTLEDELAYHREHLRSEGYVELTRLSTEFTRWRTARKWFREIWKRGSWQKDLRVNGASMIAVLRNIERALWDRIHTEGPLFMVSIAWRSYQAPGFLVNVSQGNREMCASLWTTGGANIVLQALNQNCPFEGSYGLLGNQSSTHEDGILLSTSPEHRGAWYLHIRAGAR